LARSPKILKSPESNALSGGKSQRKIENCENEELDEFIDIEIKKSVLI